MLVLRFQAAKKEVQWISKHSLMTVSAKLLLGLRRVLQGYPDAESTSTSYIIISLIDT